MPLETYTSANKIELVPEHTWVKEGDSYTNTAGEGIAVTLTCTEYKYRYVGMTKATANTCVTALTDLTTGVSAKASHAGSGSFYSVDVIKYWMVRTETPLGGEE